MQFLKYIINDLIATMGRKETKDNLGDSINIRLSNLIRDRLEEEAKLQGIYMSQLIRQILMDYVVYLEKRDKEGFIVSETAPLYSAPSLEEIFSSDEFRELLRKEVQLALKKLIE